MRDEYVVAVIVGEPNQIKTSVAIGRKMTRSQNRDLAVAVTNENSRSRMLWLLYVTCGPLYLCKYTNIIERLCH